MTLNLVEIIYSVIYWIAILACFQLAAYRAYSVFVKKKKRVSTFRIEGFWLLKGTKIVFALSLLLITFAAPFTLFIVSPVCKIVPTYLSVLLLAAVLFLALLEIYLAFSISEKLRQVAYKRVIFFTSVALSSSLSVYLTKSIPELYFYPGVEESYLIDLPVKGTWLAGHAGGSTKVNYHCAVKSQKYAIDIVKVNTEGRFYANKGKKLEDFYGFNEMIYSPVTGTIVNIVDSLPNIEITFSPPKNGTPAGNYLVIEFDKDRYVFLAHIQQGSFIVGKGNRVQTGDKLARVGNSGNTSWPHLHMHIQDLPVIDGKKATAYPFRFKRMDRKRWLLWNLTEEDFLVRNDLFRDFL